MTTRDDAGGRYDTPWRDLVGALRHVPDRVAAGATTIVLLLTATVVATAVVANARVDGVVVSDPLLVATIVAVVLIAEINPRCWIRDGAHRVVTPMGLGALGLVLLDVPTVAIVTAIAGTALHAMARTVPRRATAVRGASSILAIGAAAAVQLVLAGWWGGGYEDGVSWQWVVGATAVGATLLLVGIFAVAVDDAVRTHTPLVTALVRNGGARVTAEGALLSLAPIWVVGIDFSYALVPLLVITTVLMFRSTKQAFERAFEARHDALTGLANRRAFVERLTDVIGGFGGAGSGAVLLMDLDRFKHVNDELGHDVGDALLVAFADRLSAALPRTAVAARLGGDEFAVLLPFAPSAGGASEAEARLQRIRADLAQPLDVTGFPVSIGASIGVALVPQHGRSAADLLRAADVAMYRAKRRGTSIERYDDCIRVPKRGRVELLNDIGRALDDHQFRIHFQPQLRLDTGRVEAVEALIRWHHPEYGEILPGDFVGLVEQTDLIGPITEAVLRMATQGMQLVDEHDTRLAVNVSARSLQDRYFASTVATVLAETGFRADRLEIEVTERALVSHPEQSAYAIDRLRSAGVQVAIDDFGTGYSSFESLRMLQVDRVKVDALFVRGLAEHARDRAIVASVIDLAHRLGLDVVAEGVETTQVWDLLGAMGCDVAQGFAIARPMSFPDLRGWLTRWNEVAVELVPRPPRSTAVATPAG